MDLIDQKWPLDNGTTNLLVKKPVHSWYELLSNLESSPFNAEDERPIESIIGELIPKMSAKLNADRVGQCINQYKALSETPFSVLRASQIAFSNYQVALSLCALM